jgi:hypothetical protein
MRLRRKKRCRGREFGVWNRTSGAKALFSIWDSTVRLKAAPFQNS